MSITADKIKEAITAVASGSGLSEDHTLLLNKLSTLMNGMSITPTPTKATKPRTKRAVGAPVGAKTAYNFFVSSNSEAREWEVVTDYARNESVSVFKALQAVWKTLSDDDKEPFQSLSVQDKERYAIEKVAYDNANPST